MKRNFLCGLAALLAFSTSAFGAPDKKETPQLFPFSTMKFGFADSSGATVIPPLYDFAASFSQGLARVLVDGKYGFIDDKGATVVEPLYDAAGDFHEGLAPVMSQGKWGYIDLKGGMAVAPQYSQALDFSEGFAPVAMGDKWGFIDAHGQWLVEPKFQEAYVFSEGLANVNYNSFIDHHGKVVLTISVPSAEENWHFALNGDLKFKDGLVCYGSTCSGAPQACGYSYADKNGQDVWSYSVQYPVNEENSPVTEEMNYSDGYQGAFSEGLAPRKVNGRWGYVDTKGRMVIAPKFNYADSFSDGLAGVKFDWKDKATGEGKTAFGYIDKKGNYVLKPQFIWGNPFKEGCAQVCVPEEPGSNSGKWGTFIDKKGKVLFTGDFGEVGPFSNGLALAEKDHQYFYIDKTGRTVIAGPFNNVSRSFENGLAFVGMGEGEACIDLSGKLLVGPSFMVGPLKENRIRFTSKMLWGYRDRTGKVVMEPRFEKAQSFSDGLAVVQAGGKCQVIDLTGKVAGEPEGKSFEDLKAFHEGLQACAAPSTQAKTEGDDDSDEDKPAEKWGYIDSTGRFAIAPQFEQCMEFREGLACVRVGGLWGFVDTKGRMVIKPQFTESAGFSGGLAMVVGGKATEKGAGHYLYGYIDKNGNKVIPPVYFPAGDFENGMAFAVEADAKANKKGYIDTQGHWVEDKFKGLDCGRCEFSEGLMAAMKAGDPAQKYGYVNPQGKWVISPAFQYTRPFHGGVAAVAVDNKWGFTDATGKLVVPTAYDEVGDFSEGLAWVKSNAPEKPAGLCGGYVDAQGNCAIESDDFSPYGYGFKDSDFKDGTAHVLGRNGYEVWIDSKGQVTARRFSFEWFMSYLMNHSEEKPDPTP